MADEQHRVHWNERASYLAVLRELKEAVVREMDLVQVGAEGSTRLSQAMDEAHIARVRYRGQCQASQEEQAQAQKSPRRKHS